MIRFLVNAAVYMAAAALGLIVADVVVDDFHISYPTGFLTAVLLFGVIQAVITPFFASITEKNASLLTGLVGFISALVSLIVTEALTDGLQIDGVLTWLAGAAIVWLASMCAGFLLRVTVAKKLLNEVRD